MGKELSDEIDRARNIYMCSLCSYVFVVVGVGVGVGAVAVVSL